MLLIFLSWIYILFSTINFGFIFDKIIGTKNNNFVVTSVLGLFFTTILASIWAIFGRINIEFHLVLLFFNMLLVLKYKFSILNIYKQFLLDFKKLEKVLKLILILITLLIIAQCSTAPFVIDNESYYIQTIKWLNEYGFVKGIANLHIYLGQTSGWHITQSIFNFSFLYKNFNDLSGFCLFLGSIFSVQKLNEFYQNKKTNYLIIGLLPLFNVFLFQFISAPSPDIPVYVFSFVLFFYFLDNFKKTTTESFYLIVILVLFLIYIKNTTIAFAIIPIILFLLHFKLLSKKLIKPVLLSVILLSLYIIKNMIICGGPVFPSKLFSSLETSYAIPNAIGSAYYDSIKHYGYFVNEFQYNTMSVKDLFLKWLFLPKLNGLFDKTIVTIMLITPFLIYKFQNKKSLWILYFVMLFQMFLLFVTSPQYRFFMNFVMFFSLFLLTCFIQNKKAIYSLLLLSLIPTFIVLFFPLNLNQFANHKFMLKISNFSIDNLIFPHKNTKSDTDFETIRLGNLIYNSPVENDIFWSNGDGDLPCVNKDQIEYYKKYYETIPQMRTNDLKDGFYPKKVQNDE
ncbi:LIC_10190 family membrane protein [Flavobacterium gyeonganense]|uniref:LIC_10190 family membrane protein n=2 Tax=Flavobacterium gyeonganense TaxID=1310418 RepID=A0ABV5H6T5_9FLAO